MKGSRGDPARIALDAKIERWMHEAATNTDWKRDDARFDSLARELFGFQYHHCTPYRHFCDGRGVHPSTLRSWQDIPCVPTGAFKEVALRSFDENLATHTFRTSGTQGAKRGELHLDTLALYEASLLPTFRRFVLPELEEGGAPSRIRVLAPSPVELGDSSLSHMFGCVVAEFGPSGSGFDVVGGELRVEGLLRALREAQQDRQPVALCGTAFAFVHLARALEKRDEQPTLPAGSRVLETGGFKGRSREYSRDHFYGLLSSRLGITAERIVNQYGMTELGSQFYDTNLRYPKQPRRKLGPPWTRVVITDPETRQPAAPGAAGMIEIFDLANTGSIFALQTADLGRSCGDGFEVIGRDPEAEARGCSIAADDLLARAGD